MDSEFGYLILNVVGFFLPVVVVLVVGMVLVGLRRRRLGGAAVLALVGFAAHLVATVLAAVPSIALFTGQDPDQGSQIALAVLGVVLRVGGFILLIIAFVQAAKGGFRFAPPAPAAGPYATVPWGGPYAPPAQAAPPRAHEGQEPGELVRSAVAELHVMGGNGSLRHDGRWNPRVPELGRMLAGSGGMPSMQEAHAEFARVYPHLGRDLDLAWDGVGDWRA